MQEAHLPAAAWADLGWGGHLGAVVAGVEGLGML